MINYVEEAAGRTGAPIAVLCRTSKLSYSSYMRWKRRIRADEPVIQAPGPKKIRKPDMGRLQAEIEGLRHRKKRSYCSSMLYRKHREEISCREFMNMVAAARRELRAEEAQLMRHIQWHTPGLIWAMDDTEYGLDYSGRKLYLNDSKDLGSRYCFPPLSSRGGVLGGEKIAVNLEKMFRRYPLPLFLKIDNGSNLNHQEVFSVLSDYFVIPLISPTYYPPYNGGIEKMQSELKKCIYGKLLERPLIDVWTLGDVAENAANELNHHRKEVLGGKTACESLFRRKGGEYSRRQREQIFELLLGMTGDILSCMKEDNSQSAQDAAWRISVETWLHNQGHITVQFNQKVLPYFSKNLSHN